LCEHEAPERRPGKRPLLVKTNQPKYSSSVSLFLLVNVEVQAMPLLHFSPVQLEVLRRPPAGKMIPAVVEQNTANIQNNAVMVRFFSLGREWGSLEVRLHHCLIHHFLAEER